MNRQPKQSGEMHPAVAVAITFLAMGALYGLYMVGWQATSTENLPANELDFAVKTPAYREDWFTRRSNGLYPQKLID